MGACDVPGCVRPAPHRMELCEHHARHRRGQEEDSVRPGHSRFLQRVNTLLNQVGIPQRGPDGALVPVITRLEALAAEVQKARGVTP